MLKEKQQMIEEYFEEHGISVQTSFIRGGLSIYAINRKTPIARFVPCGSRGGVEVMWLSRATVIFHFILFWGSIVSCRMTGYVSLFSFGKTLLSMQHDGRGAPIGPWPSWP